MKQITLISTMHKENGKCNANELYKILFQIKPEVIFLEALVNTYSDYDKLRFQEFGVFHQKLEINAIQLLNQYRTFEYVPVLDFEMPDIFESRNKILMEILEFKNMVDKINNLACLNGFQFLNSDECVLLHEELAIIGTKLTNDQETQQKYELAINDYENNMLDNIYKNCKSLDFKKAVFMVGSGHRKSIMENFEKLNFNLDIQINLKFKFK